MDLNEEIFKSLEHVKLISQFKIKLDFSKNMKEFFSFFFLQKTGPQNPKTPLLELFN
jgi:hypothetical protein